MKYFFYKLPRSHSRCFTFGITPFQGRYVLRHPFKGEMTCDAGKEYQRSLRPRFEKEAQNPVKLTGWNIADIRRKMNISSLPDPVETPFWENIWK